MLPCRSIACPVAHIQVGFVWYTTRRQQFLALRNCLRIVCSMRCVRCMSYIVVQIRIFSHGCPRLCCSETANLTCMWHDDGRRLFSIKPPKARFSATHSPLRGCALSIPGMRCSHLLCCYSGNGQRRHDRGLRFIPRIDLQLARHRRGQREHSDAQIYRHRR